MAKDKKIIYGFHPVFEAIKRNKVTDVYISKNRKDRKIKAIISESKKRNIKLHYVTAQTLEQLTGIKEHQGIAGKIGYEIKTKEYNLTFKERVIVYLDHIMDPHNIGAIIRSGYFFGIETFLLPSRRGARITETVYKSSAGAVSYVNIVYINNPVQFLKKLKEKNYWLIGADIRGDVDIDKFDFPEKCVLIFGNEEKGISKSIFNLLDFVIKIREANKFDSLNVSVSAGIVFYILHTRGTGDVSMT